MHDLSEMVFRFLRSDYIAWRRSNQAPLHKSPILEFYHEKGNEIEKRDKFIVFLRRNEEERNYSFAADDAVEAVEKKPLIDSLA